jgi:peptidoglycan/LPS O-acetylase OafA/YrhL
LRIPIRDLRLIPLKRDGLDHEESLPANISQPRVRLATRLKGSEQKAALRSDVQSMRGVSVLLVMLYHANLGVAGGFIGVDLFFVISGFVISRMLFNEVASTLTINIWRFAYRRFLRLIPNLATVVSFTLFLSIFLLPPDKSQVNAAVTGLGSMLMFANGAIASFTGGYFDGPAALNPLVNLWSLSVEEQFYFILPLLILTAIGTARIRAGGG